MIPCICRVRHDPPEAYGDCLRACVASLLDMSDPMQVPHFYSDGCNADTGRKRLADFLLSRGYAPWYNAFDGSIPVQEVLDAMGRDNPVPHYLLFGATNHGDHVVICQGDAVVHDPNWYKTPLVGCGSSGNWVTMVVARL